MDVCEHCLDIVSVAFVHHFVVRHIDIDRRDSVIEYSECPSLFSPQDVSQGQLTRGNARVLYIKLP